MRSAAATWTSIPAAIAIVVIAAAGFYADHQNRVLSQQALRADVSSRLNLIRARLEGNIFGNLQLVRGLVATVSSEPDMDQARFAELGRNLFSEQTQLRNIAAAPDLVVSMVYPLEGNEQAMGLDYRNNPRQREAALRAMTSRRLVLAGPVDLQQGGRGFIGRFPVFLNQGGPDERFWGVVSAVIDIDKLYADCGLFSDPTIDIAISGADSTGAQGKQFFGDAKVLSNDPVTADVVLPSGSWQIAAVPKSGWNPTPANTWWLLAMVLVGGALIVIPMVMAGRLIEERRKTFQELRRSEIRARRLSQRLELALDASQIGVWEHDLATNVLVWDDRVNEIYGKPKDGRPRRYDDWAGTIHPDDLEQARREFDQAADTGHYSSEYRLLMADGEIRYVRTRAKRYHDGSEATKLIGAEWDVTSDVRLTKELERAKTLAETRNAELEAAKARIEHNAMHDSLTGLPNRRYLDDMLEHLARRRGGGAALLHIDLDRFKQINDTLGHAAGDAMLVHASHVLKSTVRSSDFVARIGGDEFVVLCGSELGEPELALLAERIIRKMRQPAYYQGHQCRFGVSIGIAVERGEVSDARQLLINADIALYRAKSRGRNRHEFFTEALQQEIVNTKRLADDILAGLERNEFIAHYQLQYDAKTLALAGVEALARWNHPTRGLLGPDAFLKVAEELNVVATIDRLILEQALRAFDDWREAGLAVPRISVNVSARRLQDEELIKSLRTLQFKPGTLSFELVESIFLDDDDDVVVWNVEQIKDLGIDIEIDDFGTGYASIVSLLKLKPKRLKIDRQLVAPIVRAPKQRHVVKSIIEIGKSLGIQVAAEGVETMRYAKLLRELGCDILQGYAFGRPTDAVSIKAHIEAATSARKAS